MTIPTGSQSGCCDCCGTKHVDAVAFGAGRYCTTCGDALVAGEPVLTDDECRRLLVPVLPCPKHQPRWWEFYRQRRDRIRAAR
jgi:hypothetical protein